MDRVVDAMGKAGIKVILGTPTYSIPAWMAHEHPEILAGVCRRHVRRPRCKARTACARTWTPIRPAYRFYAERLIRHMVAHYKDNPAVIGWQIDNETSSYEAANPDVFIGFQHYLKKKFGTPEALSKAWFLNYWGENIHNWDDLPTRDGAQSTGYKLEWARWSQMRVTDFLSWQAALVRECAAPGQFVTTDFGGMMKRDINEEAVAAPSTSPPTTSTTAPRTTSTASAQAHSGRLHPLAEARQLSGHRNQRADHRLELGLPVSRLTTASCARTSTLTFPTAPTWWSTGTGPRLLPIRRRTGRGCSPTTWSPTAFTPKSRLRTNSRRSARTSSA